MLEFTGERPEDDDSIYRGQIYRKHVWESMSKAAANRSWLRYYFVAKPGTLTAYKDQRHAKHDKPAEHPLSLAGATIDLASDYKKHKHCFSLKLTDGGEFMFRAKDDAEMNLWIDSLKSASGEPESSTMSQQSSSRAQTLPASAQAPEKKKGFFTLKHK